MILLVRYIECQSILSRKPLEFLNEDFEVVSEIVYHKTNDKYNMSYKNIETGQVYYIKTNPLKLKSRHIIYNQGEEEIASISIGVKIIHSIIEAKKYYFVKSAFWKIKYMVYDERDIIADLEVVRKNSKRYFKVTNTTQDSVLTVALFLLAQAVRHKAIIQ